MRTATAAVTKCPVGIGQVLGSTFSTIITRGTAALAHHYTPASQRGWRGIPVRKRGGSVGSSHTRSRGARCNTSERRRHQRSGTMAQRRRNREQQRDASHAGPSGRRVIKFYGASAWRARYPTLVSVFRAVDGADRCGVVCAMVVCVRWWCVCDVVGVVCDSGCDGVQKTSGASSQTSTRAPSR